MGSREGGLAAAKTLKQKYGDLGGTKSRRTGIKNGKGKSHRSKM